MDFTHDALESGARLRTLNVLDSYSRECLAIEVGQTLASYDVTRVLAGLAAERGRPAIQQPSSVRRPQRAVDTPA